MSTQDRRTLSGSAPAPAAPTIVSGGQTGVDRGALDAALEAGVPCGGWVPEGRMAEDGPIPERYPVAVLPGAGYRERTRRNVIDSDATVIIHFGGIDPRSGTRMTRDDCIANARPHLVIDAATATAEQAAGLIAGFCRAHAVTRLNVAGPRESGAPGARDYTHQAIRSLLDIFSNSSQ